MDILASPELSLAGLFVASLLAATLLPGGSEVALFALVRAEPQLAIAALVVATIGNTLGGMSTYGLARLLPRHAPADARLDMVIRHGSPSLLLAWAPVIGDALCAAAGWLRLPWLSCLAWMAVGKALRYGVVMAGAGW
jgi:membrane protein YqaA with SNARE-associated domain